MTVAANQRLCGKCGALASDDVSACVACGGKVVAMRAPEDVLIGRVLDDRFEIRSLLGVGGMGAVYRAYQRSTDREVAIKIIDPRQMSDVNAVRRFLCEAKLASQLAHPNTVSVFDFGQSADGYLYLVMELVKGRTLSEILRERPLGLDSAVRIAEQLCDALEVAHAQSIIHRDLKPANVMVLDDPPGRDLVKVLDFGIAKNPDSNITEVGLLVGTPRYMSPQVLSGADATADSDLYALGVMLVEITTGMSPYSNKGIHDLISQKLVSPVLPPGIPEPLRPILERLLDPDRNRRFSSAAELRKRLLALDGAAGVAPPSPRAPTEVTAVIPESLPEPTSVIEITTTPDEPRARGIRTWLFAIAAVAAVVVGTLLVVLSRGDDTAVPSAIAPRAEPPRVDPSAIAPRDEPSRGEPPRVEGSRGEPPREVVIAPRGSPTTTGSPTATKDSPTATQDSPTATKDSPTATGSPTATKDSPTATQDSPTATKDSPTATKDSPTATQDSPTAPLDRDRSRSRKQARPPTTKPGPPARVTPTTKVTPPSSTPPADPCKQKPRPPDCAPF